MKNNIIKNLLIILLLAFFIINSFIVTVRGQIDNSGLNFEEITAKLDVNNEFTFEMSANNSKSFSLFGQKFILFLKEVSKYEDTAEENLNGQPAIKFKFYFINGNSTIPLKSIGTWEKGAGNSYVQPIKAVGTWAGGVRYEMKGDEVTLVYSSITDGDIVIDDVGSSNRFAKFPRTTEIFLGGVAIRLEDQNSKIFLLIAKNPDINNHRTTFLVKEIRETTVKDLSKNTNENDNRITSLMRQIKEIAERIWPTNIETISAPSIIINNSESQNVNYNLLWKKNFGAKILDTDISSDGKTIAFISGIVKSRGTTTTTYILDEKGELVWYNTKPTSVFLSLSPDGRCLAWSLPKRIYLYPDSIETPLWIKDNSGGDIYEWDVDVSSDCNLISIADSFEDRIYLINKNGEKLWSYKIDHLWGSTPIGGGDIKISNNGYIVVSSSGADIEGSPIGGIYLLNKDGKLVWKKDEKHKESGFPLYSEASISQNGKYIAAYGAYILYLFNINGTILNSYRIEFPENVGIRKILVADSGIVAAYATDWENKIKSSVYLINTDGSLLWKKDFDSQITAMSISSYGSHILIGTENGDIYYYVGSMIEKPIEVEKEIEKENPINITIIAIGLLASGIISFFIALPYYKRAKLKREMAKTPTDWCPHCHKFTGGAKTCPHCGKETLVSAVYDRTKKVKKK